MPTMTAKAYLVLSCAAVTSAASASVAERAHRVGERRGVATLAHDAEGLPRDVLLPHEREGGEVAVALQELLVHLGPGPRLAVVGTALGVDDLLGREVRSGVGGPPRVRRAGAGRHEPEEGVDRAELAAEGGVDVLRQAVGVRRHAGEVEDGRVARGGQGVRRRRLCAEGPREGGAGAGEDAHTVASSTGPKDGNSALTSGVSDRTLTG